MKRFIILLAALLLGAANAYANVTHLKQYEPVVVGFKDNLELAQAIEKSLKAHPNGDGLITPDKCQPNHYSCGTPNTLVRIAKQSDPDMKYRLNSAQDLPGYVRHLVLDTNRDPPGSQRWMGALLRSTGELRWNAMSRPYDPDEKVYKDPDTGRPVFPMNCVNGIGDIVEEYVCDEIHFWMKKGDEVHIGLLGPEAIPDDKCRPALKRAGDSEWSLALLDTCVRMNCSFAAPAADLGLPVQPAPRISFEAEETGEYILRVPRFVEKSPDVFVFCLLWPDGKQSEGTVISKTAYRTFGWAYIDYPDRPLSAAARAKNGWVGLVHTWKLSPARAFVGERTPVKPKQ